VPGAPKVNGQVRNVICAVPAEQLVTEREVLRPLPLTPSAITGRRDANRG
jgi:hypothetical protein